MLFSIFTSFILFAAYAFAGIPNRKRRDLVNAQDIVAAIYAIDSGVNQLKADLETYNGGLLSQTPILAAFSEIEVANRAGYAEALAASNFSAAGSDQIVQAVQNTVEIDIPASVDVLKSKKPLFEAEHETEVILASMELLLYDHISFSEAVGAHLTSDYEAGLVAVAVIINAIQDGINYYKA